MVVKANSAARFVKYWLPVLIYAILIFRVSGVPAQRLPLFFEHQDIVFHIAEYAGFALLVIRAFKEYHPAWTSKKLFLWVFLTAFLYALTDEFHQFFVSGRTVSLSDIGCDGIGIIVTRFIYPFKPR